MRTNKRTDTMKPLVAFRNFAKAPKAGEADFWLNMSKDVACKKILRY
jgi:hypothetical protein